MNVFCEKDTNVSGSIPRQPPIDKIYLLMPLSSFDKNGLQHAYLFSKKHIFLFQSHQAH